MAKLTAQIFNDSKMKGKEKLLVMLLKEKSDLVVGKSISLEMITLCCVSFSEKFLLLHLQSFLFSSFLQMVGEVANYFVISIQLFVENPYS
jgi:hypothetical protein